MHLFLIDWNIVCQVATKACFLDLFAFIHRGGVIYIVVNCMVQDSILEIFPLRLRDLIQIASYVVLDLDEKMTCSWLVFHVASISHKICKNFISQKLLPTILWSDIIMKPYFSSGRPLADRQGDRK